MDEQLLLNEREAIEFLGGPRRTRFLILVKERVIPCVRIGKLVRYPRAGLIEYVNRLRAEQGI